MFRTYSLPALIVSLCASLATADITNVTQGTTHPTIQNAIDLAVNGDEIVVDPGEYFESLNLLGKTITLRSQDPTDPQTVVSTIINAGGLYTSNSVLTCMSGETLDTIVSGFVITGGGVMPFGLGGGAFVFESSLTLTHCTITDNMAELGGGGLYIGRGHLVVRECTISDNTGLERGGGIYVAGDSSALIDSCRFARNEAVRGMDSSEGGAAYLVGDADVTHCEFVANVAEYGGALRARGGTSTVQRCSFVGNQASELGGAINSQLSTLHLEDCTFEGNTAVARGGAIVLYQGSSTLTSCTFRANEAGGSGGALEAIHENLEATLNDCHFLANNAALNGGGIASTFGAAPTISACTFHENQATNGGGLYTDVDSTATVADSWFTGNGPDQIAGTYTDDGGNVIGPFMPPPTKAVDPCPEDINGDGVVDQSDLGALLAMYGQNCP